jgi:DNA-binding transcriptional ArsR family regulator
MMPAQGVDRDSAIDEFARLLDKKGSVRILDVFLANREIPVTRSDLEEQSGMSQPTVSRTVNEFLEIGIIEESEDDSPKMFRLNMEHPSAGGLISAYDALYAHVSEIQAASGEFDPDMDHSNEGSPFVELFRYPTNGEILSVLLGNPDAELKAADIARGTDVDDSTVGDNIPILVRIGVVEMIERGRHDRYQLNRDHPAVDGFLNAVEELQDNQSPREPTKDDAKDTEEKTVATLQEQLAELLEELEESCREEQSEAIGAQERSSGDQQELPNFSQQAQFEINQRDEGFTEMSGHRSNSRQASGSTRATAA